MLPDSMNGKERINAAMTHGPVDRVPVFCQLSLGHYLINTGIDSEDLWLEPEAFGYALITLAEDYRFDGILVNLHGRERGWENHLIRKEAEKNGVKLVWDDGSSTVCPDNDNPHHFNNREKITLDDIDPDKLFYIEPHDITGVTYPYVFGFEKFPREPGESFFPGYMMDTVKYVVRSAGHSCHITGEVFSPLSQIMELLGYTDALLAMADNPEKLKDVLLRLAAGTVRLVELEIEAGVDSVLVSSAFAGGGFISREHYQRFVLPYEGHVVREIRSRFPGTPIFVHTCGAIGDRIDLMIEAGYDGVDTLDPPPLGNTDIVSVKETYGERLFLKGNIDPVNLLLKGTPEQVYSHARRLIEEVGRKGGYILSSACSVAPHVPPENVHELYRASVDASGRAP